MAYIEIKDLKKSFTNKKSETNEVLKGIKLTNPDENALPYLTALYTSFAETYYKKGL